MKVRVAKLKAKLSHYLRIVRNGGTVTVCDRDTPVAEIVPVRKSRLVVRPPAPGAPKLHEVPMPPPLDLGFDIVDLLREDRERR